MNHQTFKTPRVRHGSSQVTMVVPWGSSPLHTVPSSSTGGKGTGATSMMTWLWTPPFEVKNMTLVLWWLGMILIYIYIYYIVSWIHGRSCRGETRLYMQCAKYIYIYMIFVVNPLKIYLKCWCWHREISITLATLGHSLKKNPISSASYTMWKGDWIPKTQPFGFRGSSFVGPSSKCHPGFILFVIFLQVI